MALADQLESSFGAGGFDLDTVFGGLQSTVGSLTLDAPALDTGGLGQTQSLLSSVSFAAIAESVQGVVDIGGGSLGGLPLVGDLIQPVSALLDSAEGLAGADAGGLLQALQAAVAPVPDLPPGLAGLESRLAGLRALESDASLTGVLDLARQLLPQAPDLSGTVSALAGHGAGVKALIELLGGLMAVESVARELGGLTDLVSQHLDGEQARAAIARLRLWTDGGALGGLLDGIDPNDPAAAEAVARPVREFALAIEDAAGLLVRGMAFGEATLVHADLAGAIGKLQEASRLLLQSNVDAVGRLAEAARAKVDPLLQIDLGDPADSLEAFWGEATGLIGELTAAVEGFQASQVTAPVTDGLDQVLGVLRQVNQALEQLTAVVRGAFETVRQAIEALNLGQIAEAIRAALNPVVEAIAALEALVGAAQEEITRAAGEITAAMASVRSELDTVAGELRAAFGAVADVIQALDIEALIEQLRAGIGEVVDTLESVQLQAFFDGAVEVIDGSASIVDAVPLDLLPDDALQELSDATAPVKAIDFDTQVRDVLKAQMRTILDALDTDVLGELEAAHRAAVAFLERIDPNAAIEAFERETFDPLIEQVQAVDPTAILQPVSDLLQDIKDALGAIDVNALLAPAEAVFGELQSRFDELDPAALTAPIEERIDALRASVLELTGLDLWADKVDEIHGVLLAVIDQLDLQALIPALDAAFDRLMAEAGGDSEAMKAPGAMIGSLLQGAGLTLRSDSFAAVAGWIGGEDASAAVRGRLSAAVEPLEATLATLRELDLAALLAAAQPAHRQLAQSVAALPEGSVVRAQLQPLLAKSAPLELLGGAAAGQARYIATLESAIGDLREVADSGWSEVSDISGQLRDALRPLVALRDRAVALFGRFGLDTAGKSPVALLLEVFAFLRPTESLAPLTPLFDALKAKLREVLSDGIVTPIKDGIGELETLVDAIDVGVVREELQATFDQVRGETDAFRPSVLLADVLGAFDQAKATIMAFDPLGTVTAVIDDMKAAVTEVVDLFRPSVLLSDLSETYDHLVAQAGVLDVRQVLDPILDALSEIELQLEDGLDDSAAALKRLQEALP